MRLFPEGEVMTVQKLAASQAFFKLSKTELSYFAEHLGIDVEKGADLFTTIFTMVKSVLQCPDEEATDICHKRLVQMSKSNAHAPALLQVDAALDVMDKSDHQRFRDDQDAAEAQLVNRKAFSNAYKEKVKINRGQRGGARQVKYKKYVFPATVTQQTAKTYLPPNTSIWKDNGHQAWAAHVKPYPRIRERFDLHGSDHEALKVLLQRAWALRLEKDCFDLSECPIQGLF